MTRVAIVGAGVAGLVTAARLAERGIVADVFERSLLPGCGTASWLAGGMLAPFCEAESADPSIVAPGLAGIDWWQETVPGVQRNGTLVVAPWRDRADLARFARRTRDHQPIDADGIAELEPDLAGRFSEALLFPNEGHLDPRDALAALGARVTDAGGSVHRGSEADPESLLKRYEAVVDARGAASIGGQVGLRAVRGEMLVLRSTEVSLSRPVRLLHPRSPIYVVPRGDHCFMVGATMIESADAGAITLRGTVELLNAAYALHPAFAEAEVLETGAGLRPSYPDNLPRVRRDGRVVSLNGLYRHGFLLAPALAAEAVEAVLELTEDVPARRAS